MCRLLQTGEQPLQAGRSRPNATTGKVESFSAETRLAADQNYDQTQPNEERSDSEMSAEEGDIQQFVIPDEPTLPIQKLEPEEVSPARLDSKSTCSNALQMPSYAFTACTNYVAIL